MIGIAVIGYGYWGPNLARSFSEVDGCRARPGCREPGVRFRPS